MPSDRSPHSIRFPAKVSANSRSARIRSSTTTWRLRALAGSITHFAGSSTNPSGACGGSISPNRTDTRGVRDARGRAEQDRRVEALGQGEGELRELLGFRRVGRLEHRDLGDAMA